MGVNVFNRERIRELYEEKEEIPLSRIPLVSSLEHTMGALIDEYINDKVSSTVLDQIIENKIVLEIHGIYDGHIDIVREMLGWNRIEDVGPIKQEMEKPLGFKSRYPHFYKMRKNSEEFFVLSVFPGKEYVIHLASLIKNYVERKKNGISDKILRVFRYPIAEEKVYLWSGIRKCKVVKRNDVIVIGYYIIPFLRKYGVEVIRIVPDQLFSWIILRNKLGHRILFFGFNYSYWGSIIGRICEGFFKDGANIIIHIANLGSCREPEDLSGSEASVFIPMFFTKIEGDSVIFAKNSWNPLLEIYKNYNSGIHTCVNSILEEVYKPFRRIVTHMGITGVDCEAFHIVRAVERCGRKNVGFSGIYYASDYVRKEKEREIILPYNLIDKERQRIIREKILPTLTELVAQYLQNLTTTPKA